jgi:uncharacterized membrane protein YbhN (UPF0104 family)
MSRTVWAWGRVVGSVVLLGVLVWRLGAASFLHGVRTVDAGALAAAAGIGVVSTVCCAWRWKTVAAGLGVRITLPAAVAAYYRSMFLNVTLPGGVVGDVHRGVSHGRDVSDVAGALRAVVWERFAGQLVQVLLTAVVLLVLPSPVRSSMPQVALAVLGVLLGLLLVVRVRPANALSVWARVRRAIGGDVRAGLVSRRAMAGIAVASALVVAGHAVTFLIAARTVGTTASLSRLLPLALLAMMAMVLPSAAGWGPREGVSAWAFGAAGLGAQQGIATGVAYGVMVLVASSPGAVVLLVAWLRRNRLPKLPERRHRRPLQEGTAHV